MYNSYRILVKLIKLADKNYGVIENYADVLNEFSGISKEKLFDICMYLSRMLYIDYDYYDEDNKTFDRLIILPEAYNCISNRRIIALNTTLSVVSILVALCSLFVSLLQLN